MCAAAGVFVYLLVMLAGFASGTQEGVSLGMIMGGVACVAFFCVLLFAGNEHQAQQQQNAKDRQSMESSAATASNPFESAPVSPTIGLISQHRWVVVVHYWDPETNKPKKFTTTVTAYSGEQAEEFAETECIQRRGLNRNTVLTFETLKMRK